MPKISIVIPVYQVEKYLNQCVDSVLGQRFSDFEAILVDDGSPDSCGDICDRYAEQDPRVRVIHQANGGLSAARNAGLAICEGEYVTFLDSDDYLQPDYLAHLFQGVECGADISVCSFSREEEGLSSGGVLSPSEIELIPGKEACLRLAGIDSQNHRLNADEIAKYITAWGKLYRRTLFDSLRYPVGRKHEDEFLTYKLLFAAQKVAVLSEKLYFYRPNAGGIMANRDLRSRKDYIDAVTERITFYHAAGESMLEQQTRHGLSFSLADYAILSKAEGRKNDLPKELRIWVPKALWTMYHNTSPQQFERYLDSAYPHLPKTIRRQILKRL